MIILNVMVLGLVSLLIVSGIDAYAADKTLNNSIGIAISKQCKTMIVNNFPSNCPNYETLMALNLDNSNRLVSGDFGFMDGMYQRLPTKFKSSVGIYTFDSTFRIFIDPPGDIAKKVKMITIENNLDTYITPHQMKKIDDQRIVNKYRFVNMGCTEIVIGGNTWQETLADSISYLRNSCDEKFTNFKTLFTIDDPITITDISTSQKYKEDIWKKESKETHKQYKIGSDNSTNRSVTEDKDPKYIPPVTPPFDYSKYK
jgi:hypothetical protein